MKEKIIITGSRGLLGTAITKSLSEDYQMIELDLQLGHDLTDEVFVKDWFIVVANSFIRPFISYHYYLGEGIKDASEYGWGTDSATKHDWAKMVTGIQDHIGGLNWGYRVALRQVNDFFRELLLI